MKCFVICVKGGHMYAGVITYAIVSASSQNAFVRLIIPLSQQAPDAINKLTMSDVLWCTVCYLVLEFVVSLVVAIPFLAKQS
eukprot:1144959-Pelagomonas_calceolata.AAC.1